MSLQVGTQQQLLSETTAGAGSTTREISIESDSALVTLYASVVTGSLTVSLYALTEVGREKFLQSFPVLVAPTTELLLQRTVTTTARLKVVATYTGVTSYEVQVRAVGGGSGTVQVQDTDGDILEVNPDGSINVSIVGSSTGDVVSAYSEVTSVATSVLTTIGTFTAPVGKTTYLQTVNVAGTNIAEYTVELNSVVIDKKYTYFSGPMNEKFTFAETDKGLKLAVGDVVRSRVIHVRPFTSSHNSRIQVVEV